MTFELVNRDGVVQSRMTGGVTVLVDVGQTFGFGFHRDQTIPRPANFLHKFSIESIFQQPALSGPEQDGMVINLVPAGSLEGHE